MAPQTMALGSSETLARCLLNANVRYLGLLDTTASQALHKEVGKTVRCLPKCLAEVEGISSDEPEADASELDEFWEGEE